VKGGRGGKKKDGGEQGKNEPKKKAKAKPKKDTTKAKKKRGRSENARNFTEDDIFLLLRLVHDIKPIGQKEWQKIEGEFNGEVEDDDEVQYKVGQVKDAMKELPEGYRLVISLYLLEGYDHEEIGEILGISENTSRTQFLRAKRKLNEILIKRGITS